MVWGGGPASFQDRRLGHGNTISYEKKSYAIITWEKLGLGIDRVLKKAI